MRAFDVRAEPSTTADSRSVARHTALPGGRSRAILDHRTPLAGSHHQKVPIIVPYKSQFRDPPLAAPRCVTAPRSSRPSVFEQAACGRRLYRGSSARPGGHYRSQAIGLLGSAPVASVYFTGSQQVTKA